MQKAIDETKLDLSLEYDHSQFEFIVYRKHFFKNRQYIAYITENFLVLSDKPRQPDPKYVIKLDFKNQIGFKRKDTRTTLVLESVYFNYKNKLKHFFGNSEDFKRAKELLSGKVNFSQIYQFYDPNIIIGEGASGNVLSVKDIFSKEEKAVKSLDKTYLSKTQSAMEIYLSEVSILAELSKFNTPNQKYFINLSSLYEDEKSYYIVMDLMKGKSLHDRLNKIQKSDQKILNIIKVRIIMKKLLECVKLIHSRQIIHRDIKPENILLDQGESYESLVIGDFGLSTRLTVNKFLLYKCGTPGYMAPEVINLKDKTQKYDGACDIFSCGVIFYHLLTGKKLFNGKSINSIVNQNKNFDYNQAISQLKIPEEAYQLLKFMLEQNPTYRISAQDALKHPFFTADLQQQSLLESIITLKVPNTGIISNDQYKNKAYYSFQQDTGKLCDHTSQSNAIHKEGSSLGISQGQKVNNEINYISMNSKKRQDIYGLFKQDTPLYNSDQGSMLKGSNEGRNSARSRERGALSNMGDNDIREVQLIGDFPQIKNPNFKAKHTQDMNQFQVQGLPAKSPHSQDLEKSKKKFTDIRIKRSEVRKKSLFS